VATPRCLIWLLWLQVKIWLEPFDTPWSIRVKFGCSNPDVIFGLTKQPLNSYLFIHSFFLLFVHSFIHSFTYSFFVSFILSIIHSFIHSFVQSFIHSFILSFVHWPVPKRGKTIDVSPMSSASVKQLSIPFFIPFPLETETKWKICLHGSFPADVTARPFFFALSKKQNTEVI